MLLLDQVELEEEVEEDKILLLKFQGYQEQLTQEEEVEVVVVVLQLQSEEQEDQESLLYQHQELKLLPESGH